MKYIPDKKAIDKRRLLSGWRQRMHEIIFEVDTPAGRAFDIVLLWAILISVSAAMLESISSVREGYGIYLRAVEWFFTIIFTLEYLCRIISVGRPIKYIFSFFGIVDLISIVPTYLSLFIEGPHFLMEIRVLRLLRVFRVFKLFRFLGEAEVLLSAIRTSRYKITVFLGAILTVVIIMGTIMYLIEGPENGFTSVPMSIYWAIVTITTVGYGDISPKTPLGQFMASLVMIIGYSIIAVPTGLVTAELARSDKETSGQVCPSCLAEGHLSDACYCMRCGARLDSNAEITEKQ